MNNIMLESVKIFHIVHIDRLSSIINNGWLFCDAFMQNFTTQGTTIGMTKIKTPFRGTYTQFLS